MHRSSALAHGGPHARCITLRSTISATAQASSHSRQQCMGSCSTSGSTGSGYAPLGRLPLHAGSGLRATHWSWGEALQCLAPRRRPLLTARTIVASAAAGGSSAGQAAGGSPAQKAPPTFQTQLVKFLLDQFVPIGLVVAIAVGCLCPGPGAAAAKLGVLKVATTGIFFLSGLALKRGEAARALASWPSLSYGLVAILLLTPLLGKAALALPLAPPELGLGLAVFCCMPTTLSTGVSLTTQVGGNTALALLLTVCSNLAGVFTLPFVLLAVVGGAMQGVALSPGVLVLGLVQTILMPLLAGAACRAYVPGVAGVVDANRRAVQLMNGTLLCSTPWTQVSTAVLGGTRVGLPALGGVVVAAIALHLTMLAFNMAAVRVLRLGGKGKEGVGIRRAVVLCSSQKTLPVSVAILHQLSGSLGAGAGLAVIPCVVSHMLQIVVDSMLVARWLREDREAEEAAAA